MADCGHDKDLEELDFPFLTISDAKEAHEKLIAIFNIHTTEAARTDYYSNESLSKYGQGASKVFKTIIELEEHVRKNHKTMKP